MNQTIEAIQVEKQVSITDIMKLLKISPEAIELVAMMKFLLRTNEERNQFIMDAIGLDGQGINKIVYDIRREKIMQNPINLHDFIIACTHDEEVAYENLLQEPLTDAKYNRLKTYGVTPVSLYKAHKKDPFARAMNIVRSM